MNYHNIPQKMIDIANNKLQQETGLRPLRIPYNPNDILENNDILKLCFGTAHTFYTSIKCKDGHRGVPTWLYHKKRANKYKFPFEYYKKILEG